MTVSFADLARIERDTEKRFNIGKAIAVELAAGAGVIQGMFAIAMQMD